MHARDPAARGRHRRRADAQPFQPDQSHEDIEAIYRHIQQAGVIPLSAGGDHSVTLPILRALAVSGRWR